MGQDQGQAGQKLDAEGERTSEQVREEIEQTRVEMGDTVAALAAKTDVKRQAHKAIDNAKVTAADGAGRLKDIVSTHRAAVAAAGVLAVAIVVARRTS
jgi:transposase-like protein